MATETSSLPYHSAPPITEKAKFRLVILQRVCTGYRLPIFTQIAETPGVDLLVLVGEDVPNSKVKSATNLNGISYRKLKTFFFSLGKRVLPWHVGLVDELRKFKPDAIHCEGESHFLGYLQAMYYRYIHSRKTGLILWTYYSLPGQPRGPWFRSMVKRFFQRYFDAFVVYSSFSKESMIKDGQRGGGIFVATNVGNVRYFMHLADSLSESKSQARSKLSIPDRFTVLYLGALDENKRPDVVLDMASKCDKERFNFILLGSGGMHDVLRERASKNGLSHVFLPGRVEKELPLYYRSADVVIIPGRGGIIISEAMAFGIPVIVHQADGTEYDLVENGITGMLLQSGSVQDFLDAILSLEKDPERCRMMGKRSRALVESQYSDKNLVDQILAAARYAHDSRR